MKKRQVSLNDMYQNEEMNFSLPYLDEEDQIRQELSLLLIELKAYATQFDSAQNIRSHNQNKGRLKEVEFLLKKKKAS